MTKYFPLLFPIIPGSEEAALGGADWEGLGQTPWLLLCPAGRARHRGPGHADRRSLWFPHAPGQLHQPSGGTHRYRPHLGQDAQLQGGWVREGINENFGGITCSLCFSLIHPLCVTILFHCVLLKSNIHTYTIELRIGSCKVQGIDNIINSKHFLLKQHSIITCKNI